MRALRKLLHLHRASTAPSATSVSVDVSAAERRALRRALAAGR